VWTCVSFFYSVCLLIHVAAFHELFHLWFEHVSDNIASVREGSAIALGKVLQTFKTLHEAETARSPSSSADGKTGEPALESNLAQVLAFLDTNMLAARKQANESKQFGDLENVTVFGVAAKKKRDNDEALHSNQVRRYTR
jgi:hypothetical protein